MSMCPFMSVDMSTIDISDPKKPNGKAVPCVPSCELYYNGHCSINIIAQTQYREYMKKYGSNPEKGQASDCKQ